MKIKRYVIRIAQAIFVSIMLTMLARNYLDSQDTEYIGVPVKVRECSQLTPVKERCLDYIAVMKDGELILP